MVVPYYDQAKVKLDIRETTTALDTQLDHGFSITIEASTPDLPTIDGWTDEDASGDLTELAIIISMPNVNDDTPITASFNCKFHHSELGHPSVLSKVLIRLDGKITSKKVTWA